jgi:hypothetical protein
MNVEMATTYSEFPLTFLFERQIKGIFMKRFQRVMQKMIKEWMHGKKRTYNVCLFSNLFCVKEFQPILSFFYLISCRLLH